MPDVTGKSLRAGLQTLQHFNLDIRLVGNGKIVSQHPAAGSELKNGSECILKMQQEI
jgi:beta-lactam-binding protein with PASTA domain